MSYTLNDVVWNFLNHDLPNLIKGAKSRGDAEAVEGLHNAGNALRGRLEENDITLHEPCTCINCACNEDDSQADRERVGCTKHGATVNGHRLNLACWEPTP